MNHSYGELSHSDGYVTAQMERDIEIPIETIWQMLASEENRIKWLAPGSIELKVGGRARLDFKDSYVLVDSEVTACVPQQILAFSWSGPDEPLRPIHFELQPTESGTRIRLSVRIPDDEVVARSCAGWEAHLTMLQAAAAGVSVKFPIDRFKLCREDFDQQLLNLTMAEVEVLKL